MRRSSPVSRLETLNADAFYVGSTAQDELDRIIYNSLTGALYFDADGSNSAVAAIQFATLSNHPVDLSWDDFTVISTDPGRYHQPQPTEHDDGSERCTNDVEERYSRGNAGSWDRRGVVTIAVEDA